jgi:hypothetical protein
VILERKETISRAEDGYSCSLVAETEINKIVGLVTLHSSLGRGDAYPKGCGTLHIENAVARNYRESLCVVGV